MRSSPGRIVEIDRRRGRARVHVGGQDWVLPLECLAPSGPPATDRFAAANVRAAGPLVHEIDLHGLRVEEALEVAARALDQALVSGLDRFKIIHGHGSGRLRQAIREMLAAHPNVRDYRFGAPVEGGPACTVAVLEYGKD